MEKTTIFSKTKTLIFVLIMTAVGFGVGILFEQMRNSSTNNQPIEETRQSAFNKTTYKFIDPLLGCSVVTKKDIAELGSLKNQINILINAKISAKKATAVSVYFDTRDGNWLSINPNEKYSPASLMKVPTAIAWLKEVESQPELLSKKIKYDGKTDGNKTQYFKPRRTLMPGLEYLVDDLIFRMLAYSDNNAYFMLINNIEASILNEVCSDLGINLPSGANASADFITVKQYANFFRVLNNASYLNRDMSEKALSDLSHTGFPQGIASGLPADVVLAQKFGERSEDNLDLNDLANRKELHDCGIIYYPDHPYLLCVMTKGADFDNLAGIISSISKTAYDFVDVKANNSPR